MITKINAAISEIRRVDIDDGKDPDEHPGIDVREYGSRLLRSVEALKKSRKDITREEDNREVRALRHRTVEHIDRAVHAAERAHAEWLRDMSRSRAKRRRSQARTLAAGRVPRPAPPTTRGMLRSARLLRVSAARRGNHAPRASVGPCSLCAAPN